MKNDYIDRVLKKFSGQILDQDDLKRRADDITDQVFLMIEKDKYLITEYRNLVNSGTYKQHGLNSLLGRRIREAFHLQNIGRCSAPKSELIQSYERHKVK